MLAPRKVLWSTPTSAVQKAFDVLPLSESDVVVDIGCGDGKVLLEWATLYSAAHLTNCKLDENSASTAAVTTTAASTFPTFVGIDLDQERIHTAKCAWRRSLNASDINSQISGLFHCANALADGFWKDSVTVLYLYLTPRGVRRLRPILEECSNLRVVISYMNMLPDAKLLARELISVPHQPGAAWPLYIYQFQKSAGAG